MQNNIKKIEIKNNIIVNKENKIKIKLIIYEYLICIKEMFKECNTIKIINKLNTYFISNMSGIFSGCSSLSYLPDISKWNTKNVNDMSAIFSGCSSLSFYLKFPNGIQIMLII